MKVPAVPKGSMRALVATAVVLGTLGALAYLLTDKAQPGAAAVDLLGALKAAFLIAVGYYLGSSDGSARKTEMMEKTNG